MEIYVLRHCRTKNNIDNCWSGCKTDCELSPEGELRNKELIAELSKIKFDAIYSSPLKRCLATSKEIAKNLDLDLIIDNRLIERDFGDLEGKPCNNQDKLKMSDLNLNTDLNHGVEKIRDMYENKIIPFYKELINGPENRERERVLIVTHSWVVRLSKYFLEDEKNPKVIQETPKNGEYLKFNKNNIISRDFNTIKIENNRLTKKSTYTSKFNDEIKWMISLPNDLLSYVPKVYSYHISKQNKGYDLSYITMEYIKEKSFDQIYLHNKLTEKDADAFFDQIFNFLSKAKKYSANLEGYKIREFLYDIYFKKTISRWDSIKDHPKFSNFYNNEITINNKKYQPVKYYLNNLEKTLNEYNIIDENRKFWIIHGDLCFNNILFKENKMYLIDPRGSFGESWIYGDQLYEFAKISHSISGYDSIINDYYNLELKGNTINYSFINENNKKLFLEHFEKLIDKDELPKVYLIESLLFLSMIPLHKENYDHQIMELALAIEKISKFIK